MIHYTTLTGDCQMQLDQLATQLVQDNKEIPQMLICFGDAFVGKTSLIAQFARKYKLQWLDTDKGYEAIFKAVPKEFWKNINLIRIKETPEQSVAADTLIKILKAKTPLRISEETGQVNCIQTTKAGGKFMTLEPATWGTETILVVDALSSVSDSAMAKYLGTMPADLQFKKKEFAHYDKQGLLLHAIMTYAKMQNYHVIFITHEEELEMENGLKKLAPKCGTRNFSKHIGKYFSHSIHCSIKNRKHVINSNTIGDLRALAGSRSRVDVKDVDSLLNIFSLDLAESTSGLKITSEKDVDPEVIAGSSNE